MTVCKKHKKNMGHRASITRAGDKNKLPICLDCRENSRVHSPYTGVGEEVEEEGLFVSHPEREPEPQIKHMGKGGREKHREREGVI